MNFLNELEKELKQHILTIKPTAEFSRGIEGGFEKLYFKWQVNLSSPRKEISTTVSITLPERIDGQVEYGQVYQDMCNRLDKCFANTTNGDEDKNIKDPEWIRVIDDRIWL